MTDLAHELDDHLASIGPAGSTGFEVTSLSSAAWAAQVVARNDRRLREAEQLMLERVAAVQEWFEGEKRRCDTSYLREMLTRWHRHKIRQELADGVTSGKVTKTINLPDGVTLERRTARASVIVDDVDDLPSDCKTWVPVPVKDNIRKRIDADGTVPGARLVPPANADGDGYTWAVRITQPKEGE